jgi:Tfp pilus assembly protein PilO
VKLIFKFLPVLIILSSVYNTFLFVEEKMEQARVLGEEKPIIEGAIKQKKMKLSEIEKYREEIESAKSRVQAAEKEVEKLQRQLPNEISNTENLQLISELAQGLNIKNVFLTPLSEVDKGAFFSKNYEVKAQGTFLQFLILMEKIAENERLLNIDKLKLSQQNIQQRGRFQMINADIYIEAYRYNPEIENKKKDEKNI